MAAFVAMNDCVPSWPNVEISIVPAAVPSAKLPAESVPQDNSFVAYDLRKLGVISDCKIDLVARKSWCESNDPNFTAKAVDVVGLYVAPPEKAIVLCVDEKPSIQALECKRRAGITFQMKW